MAQQVKFYSVSASDEKNDANGIYFVTGGELYKGTSRFGANKVWTTKPAENTGAISGDLYISGGVTEAFNGTSWVEITNANKWTASSYGGTGKYIQAVSQAADGTVTATAATFPTLNLSSHTEGGSSNGIQVSVTTQSGAVTGVTVTNPFVATASSVTGSDCGVYVTVSTENGQVTGVGVSADNINCSTVTAKSAEFTDLTVTSTATFSATTVSATTLTVGGVAVNNIASSTVTSTANGITVGVTTENGGVKAVTLDATSFGNVMHFRDVVTSLPTTSNTKGDIVIIGANPTGYITPSGIGTTTSTNNTKLVESQEYIWNGTGWELIGDQKTYAIESVVSASVSALQGRVTALETSMATRASVGTGTADASYGVSGSVVLSANAKPTMSISVAPVTTSAGITLTATTSLATAAAIKAYVDGVVSAATPATATKGDSDKGVQVSVTTTAGVVTSVDVVTTLDTALSANANNAPTTKAVYDALCWCGANGQPLN